MSQTGRAPSQNIFWERSTACESNTGNRHYCSARNPLRQYGIPSLREIDRLVRFEGVYLLVDVFLPKL